MSPPASNATPLPHSYRARRASPALPRQGGRRPRRPGAGRLGRTLRAHRRAASHRSLGADSDRPSSNLHAMPQGGPRRPSFSVAIRSAAVTSPVSSRTRATSIPSYASRQGDSGFAQESQSPVLQKPFRPYVFCFAVDKDAPGIPRALVVNHVEVAVRAGSLAFGYQPVALPKEGVRCLPGSGRSRYRPEHRTPPLTQDPENR